MNNLILVSVLVLAIITTSVHADCADGEVKNPSSDSEESDLTSFFTNVGCTLQRGAKKLTSEVKVGAKKLQEGAKKLGSSVKTKFGELKDKLAGSSEEVVDSVHDMLANVELINPDVLMAEQKCGKGFILDALGDCKKN